MSVILSNFQPRGRLLSSVTNASQALVTTADDHGYVVGQLVRVFVPVAYGMLIDRIAARILTVPATTQFTLDFDSTASGTYVTPVTAPFTQAQVTYITGITDNATSITG